MPYEDVIRGYGAQMDRDGHSSRNDERSGFFRGGRDDRDFSSRSYARGRDREDRRTRDEWDHDGSRDRRFGSDADNRRLAMDETRSLIASNKVEGTPVYGYNGNRLGSIRNVMIDKRSGKVRYAVLSHSSGFLGLNESYLPIEWDELRYDERQDGYRVDMDEDQLEHRLERERRGRDRDMSGSDGDVRYSNPSRL